MSAPPSATVFHLEMLDRSALSPSAPVAEFEVVAVDPPDPDLNRRFYRAVGGQWNWTDRLKWSPKQWLAHVQRDVLKTFIGRLKGEDVGYIEIEAQADGDVEIVYFGLLPNHIGKRLGGPFLSAAVEKAWEITGAKRLWLHTCTFDHEHALGNYRARGFEVFKTEQESAAE